MASRASPHLRPGAGGPRRARTPGRGLPCLALHTEPHSGHRSLERSERGVVRTGSVKNFQEKVPMWQRLHSLQTQHLCRGARVSTHPTGLEGRSSASRPSSGGLAWRLCGGTRRWTGWRCPGRRSWPATVPGPGSCPAAAPAAGCSLWAAAGAPAPGGASPSRARGEMGRTRGHQRSQRGGLMTPSCPHPRPLRLPAARGGCGPSPGSLAARCSRTRPRGVLPTGHLAAGRAWATSGQPWHHRQP